MDKIKEFIRQSEQNNHPNYFIKICDIQIGEEDTIYTTVFIDKDEGDVVEIIPSCNIPTHILVDEKLITF